MELTRAPARPPRNSPCRRIVVYTSLSAPATEVLNRAIALAQEWNGRIALVCIIPPQSTAIWEAGLSAAQLEADLTHAASVRLREMVTTLPPDMPCTTYVSCGGVVASLSQVVEREGADLILLNRPRHVALSGRLVRSLVARRTSVPVRLVGGR